MDPRLRLHGALRSGRMELGGGILEDVACFGIASGVSVEVLQVVGSGPGLRRRVLRAEMVGSESLFVRDRSIDAQLTGAQSRTLRGSGLHVARCELLRSRQ